MSIRTLREVAFFYPNLLDYSRILFVLAGCVFFSATPEINAALYVLSHALDLVDGKLARSLNQCSQFGVLLDYTTDIATEVVWMYQLLLAMPRSAVGVWMPWLALMAFVNLGGLVMCTYNSASGRYWKDSPFRPQLQLPMINDKGYTVLGYSCVWLYQCFWAALYLEYCTPSPGLTTLRQLLSVPAAIEAASLVMILYEQLMMFEETVKDKGGSKGQPPSHSVKAR